MGSSPLSKANIAHLTSEMENSRKGDTLLFLTIFITALVSIPLFVLVGTRIGYTILLAGLVVTSIVIVVMVWPRAGFFLVAASVLLIEQNEMRLVTWTDKLPIFYWPPSLEGLPERPIGFLILYILFATICHRVSTRQRVLQGGPLLVPYLLFLGCVVMGIVHGLTSGGDFKIIVVEIRPFWYLFVSYILAYNLITRKVHVRALIWLVIIAAAIKGVQGTYIYLVVLHGNLDGYREIMAHEESFFFVSLLLLLVLFLLHTRHKRQLWAALLATPCILLALIGNQRRTDYVAFLLGVAVAWVLVILCKPQRRVQLLTLMTISAILIGGYIALFSHVNGTLGAPARSIISVFYPSEQDASSNLYRDMENADLKYTVKQSPVIGWGFGKEYLQPFVLPNILADDPYYLYVPHNTIYWVWMRMGLIGYIAFWFLIGTIIVRGIALMRRLTDGYLQMVAIYIIALTFMEVVVAYADYQLFFFRNVLYLGIMAGILMKLPELDKEQYIPVTSIPTRINRLTKREQLHEYFNNRRLLARSNRGS